MVNVVDGMHVAHIKQCLQMVNVIHFKKYFQEHVMVVVALITSNVIVQMESPSHAIAVIKLVT